MSLAAGVGVAVLVAGGFFLARRAATGTLPVAVPSSAVQPLRTGPALVPLVARARAEPDRLARARAVAEAVHQRCVAAVTADDDPVPPPRSPETVWRAMAVQGERVTQLDLARLITAVLREAGDTDAAVALRTVGPRPDEPADPTGALGSYGVAVADHMVDVTHGDLVATAQAPHEALDGPRLAAVVSAQQAVSEAGDGVRDRAVQSAGTAVDLWPEGAVPLAARARVWLVVGGSSGLSLADADLRGAITAHDEASYHLALCRVLLLSGHPGESAAEAVRALREAPAWGPAALAAIALRPVLTAQDASAPPGCGALQAARAPWTDDAYALCADGPPGPPGPSGASEAVRTAAADRLLRTTHDPLRLAFAAARSPADTRTVLSARVQPSQRRETATWLVLLGRPDIAEALAPTEPTEPMRRDGGR